MVYRALILALGAASFVSATPCATTACNADNCLRALRASQYPTRLPQASEDCKRIIDATIIPALVTVTEYSTVSETNTVTIPTTLVETFYDTYTDVIHATATTDQLVTVSAPAKRDVVPSSSFPAYASPCSGIVRFSSACSCIGVTARTITAPTPSTTITLPTTATSLTSITEVVETTSVTITDATVGVTTTDTTVTNRIETTVEPPPPSAVTGIARLILNGNPQDAWTSNYDSASILSYAYVGTTISSAIQIRLDADGHLWYGDKIAKGDINDGILQFFFIDPAASTVRQPYTCSRDANNYLKCYVYNASADLVFAWRSNNFIYIGKRASIQNAGYPIVDLQLN